MKVGRHAISAENMAGGHDLARQVSDALRDVEPKLNTSYISKVGHRTSGEMKRLAGWRW